MKLELKDMVFEVEELTLDELSQGGLLSSRVGALENKLNGEPSPENLEAYQHAWKSLVTFMLKKWDERLDIFALIERGELKRVVDFFSLLVVQTTKKLLESTKPSQDSK